MLIEINLPELTFLGTGVRGELTLIVKKCMFGGKQYF